MTSAAGTSRHVRTPYSSEATSLLDQIAERALDDDYYLVRPGRYSRSRGGNTAMTALMLALFSLMITITAVQYYQDLPSRSEARKTVLSDVEFAQQQQTDLQQQMTSLTAEVDALRGDLVMTPGEISDQVAVGSAMVHGDGIRITITPAEGVVINGAELRALVNELWVAGAEAISINGQRWGALTSLRTAGGAVTVNFTSIGAPFVLSVIGDADEITDRLAESGESGYWQRRQSIGELTYTLVDAQDQTLPAAPAHRTSITRATPAPADGGAP